MKKEFLLLLIALAGVGYWWWQHHQKVDDTQLTLFGNVDIREVQLAFNGNEHIAKILVEEGDHVHKGQLLATLNTETLEASVEQIEAEINAQQQIVAKLKAGSRPEEINRARAQLKVTEARAKSAKDTYHRQASLLQKKLISSEVAENARALADAAAGEVEVNRQSLKLLEKGPRQEDIAVAQAQLLASQAGLKLANKHLEDANLYAPDEGVIRNRILQPGEMAFPQTPILSLAKINPVWVRTYLPESALGKVPLGALAEIHTDSYPDKTYAGWVGFISPTAEFTPKSIQTPELRTRLVYSARVFACNPNNELRLGMPATVTIKLGQTLRNPDQSASQFCQ